MCERSCMVLPATVLAMALALALALAPGPGRASQPPPPDASTRVDALFEPLTHGIQPGAAAMVILEGEIVHSKGYGFADLESRVRITPDSTFRLGSVSKQFTAMAIALLAERGALSLDDPASKFVPVMAAYPEVTIRHILMHTSGLPDYYDVIDLSDWEEAGTIPSNADVIAFVAKMADPQFTPGERYEYSNPAYEVLPLIVEAVSGVPFADFMRDELFLPLGMDDTLVHDHRRPKIERQVIGYAPAEGGWEVNTWHTLNGITGSGGQFSTLEDFYAWDQALYGNELLSEELLNTVFTRGRLNSGEEIDYGLGWRLEDFRGYRRIAHSGSWLGFHTWIARFPALALTIVILSNREDFDPAAVSDQVAEIYLPHTGRWGQSKGPG